MAVHDPTSLVFLFVLVAGYLMTFTRFTAPHSYSGIAAFFILGLVYLVNGTLGFWSVYPGGTRRSQVIYIIIQLSLGFAILWLGKGNSWVALLPVVCHSVVIFSLRGAIIPCLLVLLGISLGMSRNVGGIIPLLQSFVLFGSVIFFVMIFTNISVQHLQGRREVERLVTSLEEANHALTAYAEEIDRLSVMQERNRLAREIHDGLGHYLTAMTMQVRVVGEWLTRDPQHAREALESLQEMIEEAMKDVRRSVAALHEETLRGENLPDAFAPLLAECREAGLDSILEVRGKPQTLPPAVEFVLFRAGQEGLTNTLRHARASRVNLTLEYRPGEVCLRVQDNGEGTSNLLDRLNNHQSFGLFGLHQRVENAGGRMQVTTAPGEGFCLEVEFPCAAREASGNE